MENSSPLDVAAAAAADPEDDDARLRFLERVLDAELFVILDAEARADQLRPRVVDLAEGRFVLAFDRDTRMAAFLDEPAPYAALAGRRLVAVLAGTGVGIALNPGVAPSETALEPATVDWLAGMASVDHAISAARIREVGSPRGADAELIFALETKLGAMADRIAGAWLVGLRLEDGTARLGLGLAGVPQPSRAGVAAAIAEAVRFSGTTAGGVDVTFLDDDTPARAAFARQGYAFAQPARRPASAPEPVRPPKLR